MRVQAEYIWIDGTEPTKQLRSKTKIVDFGDKLPQEPGHFPEWGFDGSSTNQAEGHDSDCVLKPVAFVQDPIRWSEVDGKAVYDHYLVLCEVYLGDGVIPHPTNTRAELRRVLDAGASKHEPWFGIEQEYALFEKDYSNNTLSKPAGPLKDREGKPLEQGPYYCSVGYGVNYGRTLVETHTNACIRAGILIEGTNFEVSPGQAQFQVGASDPLTVADHLWLARWLLHRLGEDYNFRVSLDAKPFGEAFNGSGAHTNYSTAAMRTNPNAIEGVSSGGPLGMSAIYDACERLRKRAAEHIAVYGHGIEERLTGLHETCSHKEFRFGVADRGASIRIPRHVAEKGYGDLEDRRPCANADPYTVCARILKTVCDIT